MNLIDSNKHLIEDESKQSFEKLFHAADEPFS